MKTKNLGLIPSAFFVKKKLGFFVAFVLEPSNGKYTFKYIFSILAPIKKKLPWDIYSV